MRRLLLIALLLICLGGVAMAQQSMTGAMQNAPARKSPLADYAGAWLGTFEGHAWLTLRLTLAGTQITGTVQRPHDLKFTDQGELKSVSEERSTAAVQTSVLTNDGLLLTVKDPDSQEADRYLMRLTSAGTAEIRMVAMTMPPGMPKPKPWKVTKAVANAVTPVR
jgi:hypothetical protein